MKLSEAEKVAKVIGTARDQHNSGTATAKIRNELCAEASVAFPEFLFFLTEWGEVGVRKSKASSDSIGKSFHNVG